MGVVNTTPDSFYEGSRSQQVDDVLRIVDKMLSDGADIIDIGAFSTRPGADFVDEKIELKRIIPIIDALSKVFPDTPLSVDTYRSSVAHACIQAGASIINDISFASDAELIQCCIDYQIPYILMHMRGTPTDILKNANYTHIAAEVFEEIQRKVYDLSNSGLNDIIIDPGFGFSKTLDQNYLLMRDLSFFKRMHRPVLVGISRKSMIYNLLKTNADSALNGTSVLNTYDVGLLAQLIGRTSSFSRCTIALGLQGYCRREEAIGPRLGEIWCRFPFSLISSFPSLALKADTAFMAINIRVTLRSRFKV
jgi:dihydropteroate synthase